MAPSSKTSTTTLLPADAKPPKSKSAPYYSVHPLWQDVDPIPQADQSNALAAIAYHPRYSEAMSYLRALMAENEVSERALGLTEDLIAMNPAHYTVWIYRMRILKGLWVTSKDASEEGGAKIVEVVDDEGAVPNSDEDDDETLWNNVKEEIKWLDDVSFRNLKNYQIWHHRHALVDLLPPDPRLSTSSISKPTQQKLTVFVTSEQTFLAQILSLDTKNYHVWSYRQWLCSRYPSLLLPNPLTIDDIPSTSNTSYSETYQTHPEVTAITTMITEDPFNNSAWSHRYFLLFGHRELSYAQHQSPPLILKQVNSEKLLHKAGLVEHNLVAAEIEYTKSQIRRAPQNGSTWNYLSGVLKHGDVRENTLREFCEEFLGINGDLWMDQWVESDEGEEKEIGVRSSRAIEWLGEIYASDGTEMGRERSRECFKALSEKWDIIRRGYWGWKLEQLEEQWQKPQGKEEGMSGV